MKHVFITFTTLLLSATCFAQANFRIESREAQATVQQTLRGILSVPVKIKDCTQLTFDWHNMPFQKIKATCILAADFSPSLEDYTKQGFRVDRVIDNKFVLNSGDKARSVFVESGTDRHGSDEVTLLFSWSPRELAARILKMDDTEAEIRRALDRQGIAFNRDYYMVKSAQETIKFNLDEASRALELLGGLRK